MRINSWLQRTFELHHGNHSGIPAMEGLRGVAVFLVFVVHYTNFFLPLLTPDSTTAWIAEQLRSLGNAGVDLFFVLSGYLIYGMLIEKPVLMSTYLRRRAQRIYPAFLFTLLLYLLLSLVFPQQSKLPSQAADFFNYLISNLIFLPGLFDIRPIVSVSWSLSYEVFYYILMPVLILALRLRKASRGARFALFSLIALLCLTAFYHYTGPVRLTLFLGGILLYESRKLWDVRLPPYTGVILLIFVLVLIALPTPTDKSQWWRALLLFSCLPWVCMDAFRANSHACRLFSQRYLRWFGNMSYSYYLLHSLVLKFVFLLLKLWWSPGINGNALFYFLVLPIFLITLIPAIALFVWIERPYSLPAKSGTTWQGLRIGAR